MRDDLPAGTVTFLFTDVEGSTRLLHELGAEGYAEALAEHRRVVREACSAEGGSRRSHTELARESARLARATSVSEPQEPGNEASKDDEAQKETAQGEGLPTPPRTCRRPRLDTEPPARNRRRAARWRRRASWTGCVPSSASSQEWGRSGHRTAAPMPMAGAGTTAASCGRAPGFAREVPRGDVGRSLGATRRRRGEAP